MSMEEKMRQAVDMRSRTVSYKKLKDEIRKRCTTIFIGAVAKIEEAALSLDKEKFFDLRSSILDLGNKQLRALLKSLDNYEVTRRER